MPSSRQPDEKRPKRGRMPNSVTYHFTGPGDTTIRPRRPSIPYTPPCEIPLQTKEPPAEPSQEQPNESPSDT